MIYLKVKRIDPKTSDHKGKKRFFLYFLFVSIWDDAC